MARPQSSGSRKGIGGGIIGGRGIIGKLLTSCLLLLPSSITTKTTTTTTTLCNAETIMHELISTYAGGRIQDGVMFDVQTVAVPGNTNTNTSTNTAATTTTPDGITIYGMNLLTPLTTELCVELYTKSGSYATASSNPNAWTFLGSFTLLGQGPSNPTSIPVGAFDPVVLKLGDTQAFYVTTQNEKLRYTALDNDGTSVSVDVYASSEVHYAEEVEEEEVRTRGGGGNQRGKGREGRNNGSTNDNNNNNSGNDDKDTRHRRLLPMNDSDESSELLMGYTPYYDDTITSTTTSDSSNRRALQSNNNNNDDVGLSVQILTGVAKNYPFAQSWPDRVFNGALLYELGTTDTSTVASLTPAQIATAQASRRGLATCDQVARPPTPPPTPTPTLPKIPTSSPNKSPTRVPTNEPTASPSLEPTMLESTIRKVATTLHGGLKQSGCMFDIRVPSVEQGGPPEGITVIAVEMSTFLEEEICVEVYTKSGTYLGFEEDVVPNEEDGSWTSPTWSILGASTVEGKGEREPTHLPIGSLDPVFVAPGSRQAFYVTMTVPEMRYTEPKYKEDSGDLFSGSPLGHMELMVGSAVAYPFEEAWPDRIFNGAIVYALGDVGDQKYNEMGPEDRERSCPRPTDVPTQSPVITPTTEAPTVKPTKIPTLAPMTSAPATSAPVTDAPVSQAPTTSAPADAITTASPVVDAVITTAPTKNQEGVVDDSTVAPPTDPAAGEMQDVVDGSSGGVVDSVPPPPTDDDTPRPTPYPTFDILTAIPTPYPVDPESTTARLSGNCPSSAADAAGTTKNVEVEYEYTMIVDAEADAGTIVTEMENALHRSLMADMCSDGRRTNSKARTLQSTVSYQGFDSNPDDTTSGCGEDVNVVEGQACFLVQGGVTAVVDENARRLVVKRQVESFAEGVLSDPATYEGLGIQQVAFDDNTYTTYSSGDGQDESDGGDQIEDIGVVSGANKGGDEDTAPDDGNADEGLSKTGKIVIGVLAGTLMVVLLALAAMHLRKKGNNKRRRSNSQELFQEFPDEEEHVHGNSPGSRSKSSGYDQSDISAPFYTDASSAPPPPSMPPPRVSSLSSKYSNRSSSPALILNELDDVSLVSDDKSKSRFAASALAAERTSSGSVGSRGSRGSNSSGKKSVEFVRAGQSFSSRQSNQPEDTVDL